MPSRDRFAPVVEWLRQAKVALNLPASTAQHVPDHFLRDIGVRRGDITRDVQRGIERLSLLDIGWQQPRRINRR